jgi:hypothetical protein
MTDSGVDAHILFHKLITQGKMLPHPSLNNVAGLMSGPIAAVYMHMETDVCSFAFPTMTGSWSLLCFIPGIGLVLIHSALVPGHCLQREGAHVMVFTWNRTSDLSIMGIPPWPANDYT